MSMILDYNDFILENEFNEIINIYMLYEKNGEWLNHNTIEWDLSKKNKLSKFLSKLPIHKVKHFFEKIMNNLYKKVSKKTLSQIIAIFLTFASFSYLSKNIQPEVKEYIQLELSIDNEKQNKEITEINQKSDFDIAQKEVALIEGGYSDDRTDTGNFVDTPYGKRFIGTKYGISAPVLADYMGKLPTKEDMINLSYETALEIYKKDYWDSNNFQDLNDQNIATILYDGSVNQGTGRMKGVLKNALNDMNISIKGNPFNKENILEINKIEDKETLFNLIKKHREIKYREARTFKSHGDGWMNRLKKLKYT